MMTMGFVEPVDGSWTVVMINPEEYAANVYLRDLPENYPGKTRRRFYSTLTERFTEEKEVPMNDRVELRPKSITTVYSGPLD